MRDDIAPSYIHENFRSDDRIAIVLVNKSNGDVVQRVGKAERIAGPDFQKWLRHMNANRYEVYISMNALKDEAKGRTKEDIAEIRHVYLDLDEGGREAIDTLLSREDLPRPNYLLNSSPGKYQLVWKVSGFSQDQAEALQRALVSETGADPAAIDSCRVLRLPGFFNRKYAEPHYVSAETISDETYRPEQFPKLSVEGQRWPSLVHGPVNATGKKRPPGHISQSERDWAYASRALARGEPEEKIIAAMARFRRDKPDPQFYAELTVTKAAESLKDEKSGSEASQPPEGSSRSG